jgi:hypothetical protein
MVFYYGLTIIHSNPVAGSYCMEQLIAGSTDRGTIGVPATALVMEQRLLIAWNRLIKRHSQILSSERSANYILEV